MVNGEEILENQSQVRKNWRIAEKSGDSTISYWSGLHVFSILCCCGLAMSYKIKPFIENENKNNFHGF